MNDVIDAFKDVIESLDKEIDKELTGFLNYFEHTWIGKETRGRRKKPLFDIKMWKDKTRLNSLEGWHRAFKQRMSVTHPTICRLASKLRKEQSDWELTIEMVQSAMALKHLRINM